MTTQELIKKDNEIREISLLFLNDMKVRLNGIKKDNAIMMEKMKESMTLTFERYYEVIIANEYMEAHLQSIINYFENALSQNFPHENYKDIFEMIDALVHYFFNIHNNSLMTQRLFGNSSNYISNIKESIHQNCNRELMSIIYKRFNKIFSIRMDNNSRFL